MEACLSDERQDTRTFRIFVFPFSQSTPQVIKGELECETDPEVDALPVVKRESLRVAAAFCERRAPRKQSKFA